MSDRLAQHNEVESSAKNAQRDSGTMNPTDEFYRDENVLITPATGTDGRVALSVGEDPVCETPHTADARELITALENYLDELENQENDP